MSQTIDFYFDFSSPYAYLASRRIEVIANRHDCTLRWHPILLGAIFKISGQKPLLETPLLKDYAAVDLARCAREHDIPYQLPSVFPIASIAAARAIYHIAATDETQSVRLIHALFRRYFAADVNIGTTDAVLDTAAELGIDRTELAAALSTDHVKNTLREAVDAAVSRGVFGAPYFCLGEQHFWGNDRLDQLDKWLASGGW